MKITLLGLCGLIAATGLLKAGLDHLRVLELPPPGPVAGAPTGLLPPQAKATVNPSGLSPDEEAARREWDKQIGALWLVKRNCPESGTRDYHETIALKDPRGRVVWRVSSYKIDVELVQDLTSDAVPEVVLRTWDGGAHGNLVYYVYSTGVKPHCLLAYDKGNDEDEPKRRPNFAVLDLDGDGRPEIITTYDGFAYWCAVDDWTTSYGGSARAPLVLGYRRGRFVDVTTGYRSWLRRKLADAKLDFLNAVDELGEERQFNESAQPMIEYYSIALLLHGRRTARQMVLRLLPIWERPVFLRNCGLIEKVLADRKKRFEYPRAYSQTQAFASEALPPD
jgi:hypothetical protein